MEKKYVCQEEFKKYLLDARFGGLTPEEIDNYCSYLSDKILRDGEKSAQYAFLSKMTIKIGFSPNYVDKTEKYIISPEFSQKMKRIILDVIKEQGEFESLKSVLEGNVNVNDFTVETLEEIRKALVCSQEKDSSNDTLELFDRYMFVLNGKGPRMFIRQLYSTDKLALKFLDIGNIDTKIYDDKMLTKYEIFISNMFQRYLPEYKRDYAKMLVTNNFDTIADFCEKYRLFVKATMGKDNTRVVSISLKNTKTQNQGQTGPGKPIKRLFHKYPHKKKSPMKNAC